MLQPIRQGTSVGELLGGEKKETFLETPRQFRPPPEEERPHETGRLLDANLDRPLNPVAPPPWLGRGKPPTPSARTPLGSAAALRNELAKQAEFESLPGQLNLGTVQVLIQRVTACERQLEQRSMHNAEAVRIITQDLQQQKEAQAGVIKSLQDRATVAESGRGRLEGELMVVQDQMRALQGDIRQAIQHRHAEVANAVKISQAQQNAGEEDWRLAHKRLDMYIQDGLDRLARAAEDMENKLASTTADVRGRLAALEATMLSGNAKLQGAEPGGESQMMMQHLRQHLEQIRSGASRTTSSLVDLQARVENEMATRNATTQQMQARLQELGEALQHQQGELGQAINRRLETLESRLGVERHDVLARQSELQGRMENADGQVREELSEVAHEIIGRVEAIKSKQQAEQEGLRERLDAQVFQVRANFEAAEEARRSSLNSLFKRAEGFNDKQLDAIRSIRSEVEAGLAEVQRTVRTEISDRMEAERRLADSVRDAAKLLAGEVTTSRDELQQQVDTVSQAVSDARQDSADRADRLSRYIDEALSQVQAAVVRRLEALGDRLAAAQERTGALQAGVEDLRLRTEQQFEAVSEDFLLRLRNAEVSREREISTARREAERATTSSDRRFSAMQAELGGRFEAYVRHFDAAIASVQEALLAQAPRKGTPPRAMVVAPLSENVESLFSAMQSTPTPKPMDEQQGQQQQKGDDRPFSWLHSHGSSPRGHRAPTVPEATVPQGPAFAALQKKVSQLDAPNNSSRTPPHDELSTPSGSLNGNDNNGSAWHSPEQATGVGYTKSPSSHPGHVVNLPEMPAEETLKSPPDLIEEATGVSEAPSEETLKPPSTPRDSVSTPKDFIDEASKISQGPSSKSSETSKDPSDGPAKVPDLSSEGTLESPPSQKDEPAAISVAEDALMDSHVSQVAGAEPSFGSEAVVATNSPGMETPEAATAGETVIEGAPAASGTVAAFEEDALEKHGEVYSEPIETSAADLQDTLPNPVADSLKPAEPASGSGAAEPAEPASGSGAAEPAEPASGSGAAEPPEPASGGGSEAVEPASGSGGAMHEVLNLPTGADADEVD